MVKPPPRIDYSESNFVDIYNQ
uniref:Uncharacterized protein n=1 Tax=Tetranychus urticae TaxID=32264 RepID=T1KDB0_TETUR